MAAVVQADGSKGPTSYLGGSKAWKYAPCKVVAEIGCNHMGSMETAKELMKLAQLSGATYAKFQKRCNRELLTEAQYNAPHPVPHNAYGQTYGAHREFLEFSRDQHAELHAYGKEIGIEWATSVWDVTSAREMATIPCEFLKVPSACNNHFDLLKVLRDEFKGDVHVSTGMTTKAEIEAVVEFFEAGHAADRLTVYNCTSGYPVPFKDVCMLELVRLYENYGSRVKSLAFSGHHLGIAIDVAAYTLGARWIERHFTKDRTWKGTDHAASLEPAGLSKLVRDLQATHECLALKSTDILPIEDAQRDKLKYRVDKKQGDAENESPTKKAKAN